MAYRSLARVSLMLVAFGPAVARADGDTPTWIVPAPQPPAPLIEGAIPALWWVEFDGIDLESCDPGSRGNSGRDCTDTLLGEVTFDPLGDPDLEAGIMVGLDMAFERYDVTFATERPGYYIPYTMFVLGGGDGSSDTEGMCWGGYYGCDSLDRNEIYWLFRDCAPEGGTAPTSNQLVSYRVAQAFATMFGLEPTVPDSTPDIMAHDDVSTWDRHFTDQCSDLHEFPPENPDDPPWMPICDSQHRQFCPDDPEGRLQSSHQELLAMFGDRTEDTTAPAIVSMTPEDGATFWVGDNVEIAATLRGDTEDELVAVGFELWCVTGGCGGFGDGELIYTACTNPETCNAEFPLYQPVSEPWDFITLSAAPAGVWQVKLMASDYHGNAVERVVTFVIEEGGDDTGTGDGENDSGDGGSSSSGGSSGGGSSGGSSGGEGDDGEAGTDDAPPGDTRGCACAGGRTGGSPGLLLALLALAGPGVKRRRRVA